MDKFLEKYNPPSLKWEEIESLNRPIKNRLEKKVASQLRSTNDPEENHYQYF